MLVTHLLTELHLHIASFLEENEKLMFGSCCMSFSKDLLPNHLRRFKIESSSNLLNDFESNEDIRARFAKNVHFPGRQVYAYVPLSLGASFPFPRVHYLDIEMDQLQKHLLRQLEKIHTLDLSINSTIEYPELFFLPDRLGIKHLYISIYGSEILSSLPVIPSHSVKTLKLRGPCLALPTKFNDVLSHLHEINFSQLECVSDVSMFANIRKISFYACHNIIDITPLQTIPEITIEDCRGIVDYRNALTYSHHIAIKATNEDAIIDVSCFKTVKTLELSPAYKSTVLNSLTDTHLYLKRVTIQGDLHRLFTDFSHLQELTVSSSPSLTKVNVWLYSSSSIV